MVQCGKNTTDLADVDTFSRNHYNKRLTFGVKVFLLR